MSREDHFTNNEADAAAYERWRSRDDDARLDAPNADEAQADAVALGDDIEPTR